jgi:amidase
MTDICFTPARKLASLIHGRKLSATEVMHAFIAQVERVNPKVNAIVTFLPDVALAAARKFDRNFKSNKFRPLAGLPIAYKDNVPTKGIRTTSGSPVYRDNVPKEDHLIVERLTAAGAITLGKTNLPEFAAGSHTFNLVFGATLNPYDLGKSAGGSSGGAAAAVAAGMLPFADGGDLAASLRNPGNFCNVVGFRPSPGRVPHWPSPNAWNTLGVLGPIARTVSDTAFLLAAMSGPDSRAPTSISESGSQFLKPLKKNFRKVRVAWSKSLGGLPMDPRVTAALEKQRRVFKDLGCTVEEAEPDFSGATECFETLRAVAFVQNYGELVKTRRKDVKDSIIWNVEQGWKLTPEQIARADGMRNVLYHRMRQFLERYEFLLCPVNQLPPFPAEIEYPTLIAGQLLGNYLDWMKSCYYITITSHPAISVPAGFTADPLPLPVGLQIVGRYRDDFGVLQLAHAFEQQTGTWRQRPPIATA